MFKNEVFQNLKLAYDLSTTPIYFEVFSLFLILPFLQCHLSKISDPYFTQKTFTL